MSHADHPYRAVQWTPFKRGYDLFLAAGVGGFLFSFVLVAVLAAPAGQSLHPVQVLIGAFGSGAFVLLHVVLCIGPLARLTPRLKPVLYNRRHMGVTVFLLALVHAGLVLMWYHGFSDTNVFVSLFTSNSNYGAVQAFPFESLGFIALVILFLMAATSHDFFNAQLGPRVWKALHMGVYLAYVALVAHVMLGSVQAEKSLVYPAFVGAGAALVAGLHLYTGLREMARDTDHARGGDISGWVEVCPASEIPQNKAVIVVLAGSERVAVFRYGNKISAVSNVCRHQAGPLGEGCIQDGLVTCPWHGFQYRPEDGVAPAPFSERIATYNVKLVGGVVFVHASANPPGTRVEPAEIMDKMNRAGS